MLRMKSAQDFGLSVSADPLGSLESRTPTRPGTFRAHYKLTWHDLKGTHTLDVVLTGKAT